MPGPLRWLRFGIANTKDPCAGRALFDQDAIPRGDPSTAVQRIVANELKKEVLAAASSPK